MMVMRHWLENVIDSHPWCNPPQIREHLRNNRRFMNWFAMEWDNAKEKKLRKDGLHTVDEGLNHDDPVVRKQWRNHQGEFRTYLRQRVSGPLSKPNQNKWYVRRFPDENIRNNDRVIYQLRKKLIRLRGDRLIEMSGPDEKILGRDSLDSMYSFSTKNIEVNKQRGESAIYQLIDGDRQNFLKDIGMVKTIKSVIIDKPINRKRPDIVILFDDNTAMIVEVQSSKNNYTLDWDHISKVSSYKFLVEKHHNCEVIKIILLAERCYEDQAEYLLKESAQHDDIIEGYVYKLFEDGSKDSGYRLVLEDKIK